MEDNAELIVGANESRFLVQVCFLFILRQISQDAAGLRRSDSLIGSCWAFSPCLGCFLELKDLSGSQPAELSLCQDCPSECSTDTQENQRTIAANSSGSFT